jgi:heme/copper-type cytochrome/quinol oxidase subunit 2
VNGVLIVVWLCAAIAAAVFATMIVSMVTFGGSLRDGPPTSVSSRATEILWALIPIAIVLATAIPALRTIVFVADGEAAHSGAQSGALHSAPRGESARTGQARSSLE